MDRDELLELSVEYFIKTFSKNGKLKINKKINQKIKSLQEAFGIEQEEILQLVFDGFLSREVYKNYKIEKALSTFIVHSVQYGLNDLYKKKKTHRKHYKEICLGTIVDNPLCENNSSYLDCHKEKGLSRLIEFQTPEDLLICKELTGLIFDHFGELDACVLLGYEDRNTALKQLSMNPESYRKRVLRKKILFIPVLIKAGYLS